MVGLRVPEPWQPTDLVNAHGVAPALFVHTLVSPSAYADPQHAAMPLNVEHGVRVGALVGDLEMRMHRDVLGFHTQMLGYCPHDASLSCLRQSTGCVVVGLDVRLVGGVGRAAVGFFVVGWTVGFFVGLGVVGAGGGRHARSALLHAHVPESAHAASLLNLEQSSGAVGERVVGSRVGNRVGVALA